MDVPPVETDAPDNDASNNSKCNKNTIIKISIGSIVLGFIIFVIIDSTQEKHVARTSRAFLSWVEENPTAGVFSFMAVYFVATGE